MAIVTAERLNRFMNEPRWKTSQYEEATDLLLSLENTLARQLGTHITPTPCSETVTVLASGLVNTTWHVHSVLALDTVTIAEGDPLPGGWEISNHWLRRTAVAPGGSGLPLSGLTGSVWSGWGGDLSGRAEGQGRVYVSYMAGLGPLPELRGLILKKAKVAMENRYDETVVARDLDTADPPVSGEMEFTDSEMAAIANLRNLVAWK